MDILSFFDVPNKYDVILFPEEHKRRIYEES